jgi:hypothetical protein
LTAAIAGFSGVKLATESVAVGVNPVDQTVLDTEGASSRAFDIGNLGNATGAQVAVPPQLLDIKARDVGQIFGLAFDTGAANGVPNLYAAATSKFGLQIAGVPDAKGVPTRLKTGSPGAKFMEGQFGGLTGAGPGSVYKLDGATGSVSVFANIANTGPALGGIAIDAKSRSLYVSDLDSGIIHRFALDTADAAPATSGAAMFDHGVSARPAQKLEAIADDNQKLDLSSAAFKPADPATWGLTQAERRVEALAVHDGRLFYGVASGPEVWSVGLAADGYKMAETYIFFCCPVQDGAAHRRTLGYECHPAVGGHGRCIGGIEAQGRREQTKAVGADEPDAMFFCLRFQVAKERFACFAGFFKTSRKYQHGYDAFFSAFFHQGRHNRRRRGADGEVGHFGQFAYAGVAFHPVQGLVFRIDRKNIPFKTCRQQVLQYGMPDFFGLFSSADQGNRLGTEEMIEDFFHWNADYADLGHGLHRLKHGLRGLKHGLHGFLTVYADCCRFKRIFLINSIETISTFYA